MTVALTDERLILQLYDHLPDAVVWYTPVFSASGDVEDFLVQYCNEALCRNLKVPKEDLIGNRLSSTRFADRQNIAQILAQCKTVFETGETSDVSYHSQLYDRFFHVTRIRVLDGVLNVIRDRTREWKLEMEKQDQNALTAQIVNASPTCVVLCQALRRNEAVEDFLVLSVNDKIVKDMNRLKTEIEGKTYCELHPAVRTNGYLSMLRDVVTTGNPFRGEMLLECFGGWQFVSAEKVQ